MQAVRSPCGLLRMGTSSHPQSGNHGQPSITHPEQLSPSEITLGFSPEQTPSGSSSQAPSAESNRLLQLLSSTPSNDRAQQQLQKALDDWVDEEEKEDEREVRQNVRNIIIISNGQLIVEGNLDLSGTNISSLPQGLCVRGTLDLCSTPIKSLPENLHVGEHLFLMDCTSLEEIGQNLDVGGSLLLTDCGITELPQNVHVGNILNLESCSNLQQIGQDLHVGDELRLIDCGITALPQSGVHVGGNLRITNCTRITQLPEWVFELERTQEVQRGVHVGGNLALNSCTQITQLPGCPGWVFGLERTQEVWLRNTGISANLLQSYNNRQNTPGYQGPRFQFSINDYRPTSNVNASQLKSLVQTITQSEANHPLWDFASQQTGPRSPFNDFAEFLTRLLNELPEGDNRQGDLAKLKETLTPLFEKMEKEYDDKEKNIGQCDFINNHILSAASTAIESCIDKVKIGYLFMQLFAKNDFQNDLAIMNTIIKTVEDIGAWRVIFDNKTKKFVDVAQTILSDKNFEPHLKLKAKHFLRMISPDSNIDLTHEEETSLETIGDFELNTLTQYLVSEIQTQSPERYANIRIGDEVEDMLNIAYRLLGPEFHKINMSFTICCTLKNIQGSEAPQYETAAIAYVQQQRNHNKP